MGATVGGEVGLIVGVGVGGAVGSAVASSASSITAVGVGVISWGVTTTTTGSCVGSGVTVAVGC